MTILNTYLLLDRLKKSKQKLTIGSVKFV